MSPSPIARLQQSNGVGNQGCSGQQSQQSAQAIPYYTWMGVVGQYQSDWLVDWLSWLSHVVWKFYVECVRLIRNFPICDVTLCWLPITDRVNDTLLKAELPKLTGEVCARFGCWVILLYNNTTIIFLLNSTSIYATNKLRVEFLRSRTILHRTFRPLITRLRCRNINTTY